MSIKMKTEVLSKPSTLSHIMGSWLLTIAQISFSAFLTGYQCRLTIPWQLALSKLYFALLLEFCFLFQWEAPWTWNIFLVSWNVRISGIFSVAHATKLWVFTECFLEQNEDSRNRIRKHRQLPFNQVSPKSETALWRKRPSSSSTRLERDLRLVHLLCYSVVSLYCSSAEAQSCSVS